MAAFTVLLTVALVIAIVGVPGYLIGQRRGVAHAWIAFIPFVGLWIVLAESTGHSGWFGVAVILPVVNLLLNVWFAVEVPTKHGRSRWWILALIVPGLNLLGYWAYALTLPRSSASAAFAAG